MTSCSVLLWRGIVDQTGTNVRVKFGDSRSNRSGDKRAAHFVMNDDAGGRRSSHKAERQSGVFPENAVWRYVLKPDPYN